MASETPADNAPAAAAAASASPLAVESPEDRLSERELGLKSMKEDAPPQVALQFSDLDYSVNVGPAGAQERRKILHGVCGVARPGEVVAIMGPTGAGKSTLLNILAGQVQQDAGQVLLNGVPRKKSMKRFISYVLQDDMFFPNLTVRETLTYTALLRLPRGMSREQKLQRVNRVLRMLNMEKVQNSKVGGMFMRGLSGGERRRLNIGNEIITNPSLLLCDEPTSGLDSATAHAVVDTLADLARSGRAVVMTIHQPSSIMYRRIDKLLLLAEGRTIYYGPALGAAEYFAGHGYPCPPLYNLADFLLELVTAEQLKGDKAKILPLADAFREYYEGHYRRQEGIAASSAGSAKLEVVVAADSPDKAAASGEVVAPAMDEEHGAGAGAGAGAAAASGSASAAVELGPVPAADKSSSAVDLHEAADEKAADVPERWAAPWTEQFMVLLDRAYRQSRGERIQGIYLFQTLFVTTVCSMVWFRMKETEGEVEDRLGCMFFISIFMQFSALFMSLTTFPMERPVVTKERNSGSYRLSSYFVARSLSDIPLDFFYPSIMIIITYWVCGLNPGAWRFVAHWLTQLLSILAMSAIGLLFSVVVLDFKRSLILASVSVLAAMLLGGFYADADNMPIWFRWVQWVSPIRYTFALLCQIEFTDTRYTCATNSGFAVCRTDTHFDGEAVLARDRLDVISPGWNVFFLVGTAIVVRYAAYRSLRGK